MLLVLFSSSHFVIYETFSIHLTYHLMFELYGGDQNL